MHDGSWDIGRVTPPPGEFVDKQCPVAPRQAPDLIPLTDISRSVRVSHPEPRETDRGLLHTARPIVPLIVQDENAMASEPLQQLRVPFAAYPS
jgi:hypothetical protein